MRESAVRGAAIDISDFERHLRSQESNRKSGDPLSELAKLMQGDEQAVAVHRYDQMFSAEAASAQAPRPSWRRPAPAPTAGERLAPAERSFGEAQSSHSFGARDPHLDHSQSAGFSRGADAERYAPQAAEHSPEDFDDESFLDEEPPLHHDFGAERQETVRRSRLRPWHVVVAVALLGAGGVAWSLAHNGGVVGSREIATIKAPEGPAKVQPPVEADATASAGKPDASVLDHQESAPVKQVVSHQEQAVEPRVEPRNADAGPGPADAERAPPVTVTAPKKVKTVSVRPDGTLIENALSPPAIVKATGAATRDSAEQQGSATPKSAGKPSATPHADKIARANATAPKPKPASKPAEDADHGGVAEAAAEDAAPPPAPSHAIEKGSFSVQFGAPASEAEARNLIKQVTADYGSELGGLRPTFKAATVGEKTVYRVRAGGISKEAAASVCSKVKASGGDCFVAAN